MLPTDQIIKASAILADGGIILYPADSMWGLGCDAFNKAAYNEINAIKNRPENQSLILLVASFDQLHQYAPTIHPRIETLLEFHSKPLTIIYPNPINLPDHCLSEDGSVAIRLVRDPFCEALIEHFGGPITSTSPNIHGQVSPKHFGEINSNIISRAGFVFDYKRGRDFQGVPSIVAKYNKKGDLDFLRYDEITK